MADRKVIDLALADSTDIQSSNSVFYLVNPDRALNVDKDRKLAARANVVFTSLDQTIGGDKTFTGDLTFSGDPTFSGDATFSGDITLSGNPTITGNFTFGSTPTLAGDPTFSGNATFSNTITGSISGNAGTVTNGVYTSRQVSAGSGLTGGGDLSADRTITHATPSPVATDSNNSNGTVIQDLTFDSFGHTASVGTTNLDSRYLQLSGGTLSGVLNADSGIDLNGANLIGWDFLYGPSADNYIAPSYRGFRVNTYTNPVSYLNFGLLVNYLGFVLDVEQSNTSSDIFILDSTVPTGLDVFIVEANGDVLNGTGSYGTISDARLKTDVVDANSQWSDIKSLRVVNYRMKNAVEALGDEAPRMLGVVAQEVEAAGMAGLVADNVSNEDGSNQQAYKSVKYSILYMKAVKALQEAMERIEVLESKVESLGG